MTSYMLIYLQLELVDGALDEVNRCSVVEGDVLVGDQLDDLLAGESTEEGGGRRRSKEATSNTAVSETSMQYTYTSSMAW